MMKKRNRILTGFIAACAAYIILATSCTQSPQANPPQVTPMVAVDDVDAGAITTGRARSLVIAAVGLFSVVIGGLARAHATGRIGRAGAIGALILGLIAMVLSVVHLATFTGGFGTGSGRAGAIVALVLGLIGIVLGGLALARNRRYHGPD